MFVIAFEIPNMLQYFEFWSRGISTSPIPMNRITGFSLLLFCYFVQPLAAAPHRNMTLISWAIALVLMVFGWKRAYLINELGLVMMLFASCVTVMNKLLAQAPRTIED